MRKTILFLGCCLLGLGTNSLFAQQGNAAAGGEATGAGGMVSYTIGLVDYINATSNSGTITQGLQQPADQPGGMLTLSGVLTYDNVFSTALNNCTVQLKSGNTVVANASTDGSGYYVFNNPDAGTYSLNGVTANPWGSCNATDALLILKHFTGASLLNGLRKSAADLDGSGYVNATDALQAMKRFVGLQNSFTVGDWVFEHPFVDVDGINSFSQNFKGLCTGDVDGSYVPGLKAEPSIFLASQGIQMLNNNQIVVVPVRINESMSCAAMSLIMNYSSNLEILNVEAAYDKQNLLFNTIGNELRIAWNSLQPKNLNKDEVILNITLKLKNSDNSNLGFTLNPESSIADYNGITILNKTLSMPVLLDSKQGFSLSQNVPNPFTQLTQISYVLPEDGNVKLELLDMIGQQLSVLEENQVKAGAHTFNFSGNSLPNGVYFYRMNVTTGSQTYSQTKRMVISR